MAIAFRAAGSAVSDATAPFSQVVGFPAGLVAGDICILIGCTDTAAGGTMSISNNGSISSWTPLSGSPISVTAGEKLYVWWGRYVSGSTGPTVDATTDHLLAAIVAYSGCVPNGSPIDVVATGNETTSDTSFSFATGLTTSENNTSCVCICTSGFDSASQQFPNAFTNANLVSCTRRAVTNQNTTAGGGGGFGFCDGILATAGAMGTFATTLLNATPKAYIAFSLRPDTSVNVAAGVGSLTLDGFAPSVVASDNKNINAGVGALVLTGFSPVLDLAVNPGPGQLVLNGFAPTVVATDNKNVLPGVGQLSLNGFAPTIETPVDVKPDTGQLSIDGFAPTIQTPVNIHPDTGQLIVTGFEPTVSVTDNKNVEPGAGQLSVDGFAPVIELPVVVKPEVGQLVVTGFEPNVFASDNKEVLPGTGQLTLVGFEPSLPNNISVFPGTGILVVEGFAPKIDIEVNVFPGKGDLILTGFAPFVFATKSFYDFICPTEKVISESVQECETVKADYNCSQNSVIIESK